MVGVGGIGSGSFFLLNGDHTLGREESRGGRFQDRRDYCKLHIISHYVKALLGPGFAVIPVGKVGDDDMGRRLLAEMKSAGLALEYVSGSPGDQTLFSFCFIYPDGSGGNMTTDDSACAHVDVAWVKRAGPELAKYKGKGIALAVPEVPLDARVKLLEMASAHGLFRAASFTTAEIGEVARGGLMRSVDLLAVNLDEAAAAAGIHVEGALPQRVVDSSLKKLAAINPRMLVSITAGKRGSWSWDGRRARHLPVFEVPVISTAGAGDAHLSGILAGLAAGLPLAAAQELGTLVAAHAVTSPHTIDDRIDRPALLRLARESKAPIGAAVMRLLKEG